jgi:hypothetical protein
LLKSVWKFLALSLVCGCSSLAIAGEITCLPDDQRVATLSDAIECKTLNDVNLHSPAQIDALFDDLGSSWVKEGELTAAGSNDLFTVTADSWGTNVNGQWFIAGSFWQTYGRAVITMHVGHGGGNPDAFAWLITPGQLNGDFSYEKIAGGGGGLSNLFLFGSGDPVSVDPHSVSESNIALLLLIGLLSLVVSRRRSRV